MGLLDVLSTIASPITSLVNSAGSIYNNERNIHTTQKMQREANEFALQQQREAQDYNSPANQLRLYSEAGMNPNLITGEDFVPTQAVQNQSIPNYSQPSPFNLPTESLSQTLLNRENSRLANQQALSESTFRSGYVKLQNLSIQYQGKLLELADWQSEHLSQQCYNLSEQTALLKWNQLQAVKNLSKTDAERENIEASTENIKAATEGQVYTNKYLMPSQIRLISSQVASNQANAAYLRANAYQLAQATKAIMFQNSLNEENRWYHLMAPRQQFRMNEANISFRFTENNFMEWRLGVAQKYGILETKLGLANDVLRILTMPFTTNVESGSKVVGSMIGK